MNNSFRLGSRLEGGVNLSLTPRHAFYEAVCGTIPFVAGNIVTCIYLLLLGMACFKEKFALGIPLLALLFLLEWVVFAIFGGGLSYSFFL